ncbi:MAG: phage minor capsid protein [Candidatus Pelethousia sp.]|nr:phage minor capsid protein [Candidatus Pelethousia sp.]
MLNSELSRLYDRIEGRIWQANAYYLRLVAEQLAGIGELSQSRVNMLVQMRRQGVNLDRIKKELVRLTGLNVQEIQAAYERIAEDAYTDAGFMYLVRGVEQVPFADNLPLQMMVRAISEQTQGAMFNYSNTTNMDTAYQEAVSKAIQAVTGGVGDYNTEIRRTVRDLGGGGIKVAFPSGVQRRMDATVRQNVLDGVRQISHKAAEIIGQEIGADAWELSAHPRSAPDHEPVQGHVIDATNFTLMQSGQRFMDIDGRSFQFRRPISEWNCRHIASPFILGASKRRYTQEQLDQWAEENKAGCTVGGRHMTLYEATQEMRRIELDIRRQNDIANMAKITGDDVLRRECQSNIRDLHARYDVVARAGGLKPRLEKAYRDRSGGGTLLAQQMQRAYNEKRREIWELIRSSDTPKALNRGSQNKHIRDSVGYISGRSYIYGGLEAAQSLVNQYSGTGEIRLDRKGNWTHKEYAMADHIIGAVIDLNTSNAAETRAFLIHYGKKGTHIVPTKEVK